MSDFDESVEIGEEASVYTCIQFTHDFTVLSEEGEDLDPVLLGVLLSTIDRLMGNCVESLAAGAFKSFYVFGQGRVFELEKAEETFEFNAYKDVSRWSELGADFPIFDDDNFPMLPTRDEISSALSQDKDVLFYGIRAHTSTRWQFDLKAFSDKEAQVQAAGVVVMQIDVLLKSSQHPRGRTCIRFEKGTLYVFANSSEDYLMVFLDVDATDETIAHVLHCGEAFVLS